MELRNCGHHFIQAIQGGLVTKVLNVTCGQPTLKFKDVTELHGGLLSDNGDVKAKRSCIGLIGKKIVKTEPDASVSNPNDGDDRRIDDLDDNGFDKFTLMQIKELCKTRKRKCSQGLAVYSRRNIKIEASSSLEDYREKQMAADDFDLTETISSWISKVPKNMKAKKKKCKKDPISTYTQEIMSVVKSENIQDSQEFQPSSGDSAALVEEKFEDPKTDCLDGPDDNSGNDCKEKADIPHERNMENELNCEGEKLDNYGNDGKEEADITHEWNMENELDCEGKKHDDSGNDGKEEADITHEWNMENELNCEGKKHDNSGNDGKEEADITHEWNMKNELNCEGEKLVESNSQLSSDQSPNLPSIEFESEECIIHQDLGFVSPQVISADENHNSDIHDNQPDGDTDAPVLLLNVDASKGLDCSIGLAFRDDEAFLSDCSKDEFTEGAEVQSKPSSIIEHGLNPDGCSVGRSDDSPEFEEKQSFASVYDDEKRHVNESSDEFTSWDEHTSTSKLHHPERLLSTRKVQLVSLQAISPSSQERLCKATEVIDLNHKNNLKCRGKLYLTEQTDKKNVAAEGLDDIMRAGFTNNPNKTSVTLKTYKRGPHPKCIFKIPHSSHPATHIGCSSLQSCSKSAIAFSKQQMRDAECLAVKLTKELNSMKDIMDDMLRSEFCLNTSLRYKVNEARMAVKNATNAEEGAKRCLTFMKRDCSRFCKIMKLADDGAPASQDVVRKERKKIAFADEAGGSLCQVRFYEDDEVSESK
ncbi:uncharacterized protein LOC133318380 [Gastrolobium bilobum]|uniref:uncharacterized protein LOC133318380 n=1 Tax=Gastrolobium bilobum TaxID=150636 RepID=UPI002AB08863|nr:uncharacterized protein LOC133318380 [Gastrolobium bilobum]